MLFQSINLHLGLLATEILLIFLPAWLFIRRMQWSFTWDVGLTL